MHNDFLQTAPPPKDSTLIINTTTALVTYFKFNFFFLSKALSHYYNCKIASSLFTVPNQQSSGTVPPVTILPTHNV